MYLLEYKEVQKRTRRTKSKHEKKKKRKKEIMNYNPLSYLLEIKINKGMPVKERDTDTQKANK